MEPAIKSKEALEAIASVASKPWYKRVDSWLVIVNIVALIVNITIMLKQQ